MAQGEGKVNVYQDGKEIVLGSLLAVPKRLLAELLEKQGKIRIYLK